MLNTNYLIIFAIKHSNILIKKLQNNSDSNLAAWHSGMAAKNPRCGRWEIQEVYYFYALELLGAYVPGKDHPIIIKLHFFPDKQFILSKASNLRGSCIFINEDY